MFVLRQKNNAPSTSTMRGVLFFEIKNRENQRVSMEYPGLSSKSRVRLAVRTTAANIDCGDDTRATPNNQGATEQTAAQGASSNKT